jgi:acetyl-CoA carboxylase, biotin carboxylase subunit
MRFRRLLIANRGEIAARIIRTCRRLGIESVLAASEADLTSVPARLADRVVRLGPAPAGASYLDVAAVVEAARAVSADAIHPGYGFLSENRRLSQACVDAGVVFIGPTPDQLAAVGDKLAARGHALEAGLPVVPGREVGDLDEARRVLDELGTPVLIKAVGGGGGRGMQLLEAASELSIAVERAMAEADAAFGDPRIYIERYIRSGRHVEVQVLGDGDRAIHLGDRDCSVQRRYQKLIEEAPAPHLEPELRDRMREAAVALSMHLKYRGAGTVEFLVDVQQGSFHFLEMNARIQVEHPVTEAITGIDLVAEQIAVAEGRPLRLHQEDVTFDGHAFECRLNAEDWERDFAPDPGTVTDAVFPVGPGIRVDTHIQAGELVTPYYDSLLAKLIVHGSDRDQALGRLRSALARCSIEGVHTTVPMHMAVTSDPAFVHGGVDTTWFASRLERRAAAAVPGPVSEGSR